MTPLSQLWLESFVHESNNIDPQPKFENRPGDPRWDDHLAALNLAITSASERKPIDPRKVHGILMGRMWPEIAGQTRTVNMKVGPEQCPHFLTVRGLLASWVDRARIFFGPNNVDVRALSPEEKLLFVWQFHVEFEKIHPFRDGNGRTGRIVMVNHALLLGAEPPLVTYDERHDYYRLFDKN